MAVAQVYSEDASTSVSTAGPVSLNDVLCTEELHRRTPRQARFAEESEVFRQLARCLAHQPQEMLHTLVEQSIALCNADSAGVSLLEKQADGTEIFRWVALAGKCASCQGGFSDRTISPCGVCLDQSQPVLFSFPERLFPCLQAISTHIVEGLVLPLRTDRRVLGTIWILSHDPERHFDSEDVRVMTGLADFTAAALQITRDSTERKEAQERLRLFIENVTDYALLQVDTAARISSWNTGAERTFGYKEEEILGQPMRALYLPEDALRGDAEKDLDAARENGRAEDARWLVRKGGSRFFGRWVTTPMRDEAGHLRGYAKVLRDETERRNAEQQMRASLAEKHALLQEIHHRVKNNLQVINSLLSIQAVRIDNPEVSAVLADTESRVRAIAALHETLYSSQDLSSIEFGCYVQRLVRDLVGFYGVNQGRIKVTVCAEDLVVGIGQAIPLGLILNELVTNSLKHAFPNGRSGTLQVQLKYLRDSIDENKGETLDQGLGQLTVEDNGVGLPPGLKCDETPSMGFHLVNVLAQQLRGELNVERKEGASVSIKFPLSGEE